jgi:hypothetical protein
MPRMAWLLENQPFTLKQSDCLALCCHERMDLSLKMAAVGFLILLCSSYSSYFLKYLMRALFFLLFILFWVLRT